MAKNKNKLYASASAVECADPVTDGCYRKFFGERVLKLPQPPRSATTFGDVIHEVAERWLDADNNGRDLNGNTADLYPKGWEYPKDKFTGKPSTACVTPEEAAIVKLLISKAIEEGILTRMPGRKMERKISFWEVLPDIQINGFIDLDEPDAIVDHKSTKDMKWAKSTKRDTKNSLHNNIQLMLYAYWKYTEDGYPVDQRLRLRHNYFCKDPKKPHVESREVFTTWEEVSLFWTSRIEPVLRQMKIYKDNPKLDFLDLPMPENPDAACRKYGGCEFTKICTGFESVNDYKRRMGGEVDKQNKEYAEMANNQGGAKMSESAVMKKIREKREAAAKAAGQPVSAKVEEKAETPQTETVNAAPVEKAQVAKASSGEGKQVAPWYQDGCKICSKSDVPGIRPDMSGPCAMCKMTSKKAGGPVPEDFEWDITEGSVIFLNKETGEEVARQVVAEEATAKEKPATAPVEEVEEEQALPPIPEQEEQKEPGKPPAPITQGESNLFEGAHVLTERDKFELVIEAAIIEAKVKGGGKLGTPSCVITGEELHQMVITHLSAVIGNQGGSAGWYGINAWTRKDAIAMYGRQIAEMLGSTTVVIARLTRASELETIVQAIRPYAKRVIQALQG